MSTGPSVRIRPLTPADAEACDRIVLSLPYHFGQADGRAMCAEAVRSEPGLVAEDDGPSGREVVGFCTLSPHFERSAEITWIAVHADRRGQGIGRALVEEIVSELRSQGRTILLVLTVSASDGPDEIEDGYDATRAFYRSTGFVEARDLTGYWERDTPVLMVRSIAP